MTKREVSAKQPQGLDGLLEKIASLDKKNRPVVVFDLDDTLLSTNKRHLRILKEFASKRGDAAKKLAGLAEERLKYSIVETAKSVGISDAELIEELKDFWFERFFANEYITADHPVAGAPEYCREVAEVGAVVAYFTGRDENMREGTLATLKAWGFPMPDESKVFLILKPRFDMPDLDYKREGLRRIAKLGPVAASFENEPAHINLFQEAFPESWLFLLETKHSGKPVKAHPSSRRIKDFRR